MQIPPLQRPVKAADVPLEQLAGNSAIDESRKVAELSRQFEALLVRQILNEAQKNVLHSSPEASAVSGAIYQDIVTGIQADSISRSGALGLSQTLERQLQREAASLTGSDAADRT